MTKIASSARLAPRRAVAVAGVALLGLVLAACGSSTNTAATTTTTASPGGSSSATTTAGSAGSSLSDRIGALSSQVQAAEKATFKAVYTTTGEGSNTSVTIAQSPPKSVYATSDGSVIDTGSASYYCSSSRGQTTCVNAGPANPLASIAAIFSPATALTELKAAQTEAAAHLAGYDVSFSTETFAGQDATCATIDAAGKNAKYCVTKQGILAYAGTSASNFSLTSYDSSPPASDFALPAGATVATVP